MKKAWVIFIVAFGLYFVSVFGGFVQDDTKVIVGDPDMGKITALASAFVRPYYYMDGGNAGIYRPLTSFSFYLNALITGNGAWGFHLINVMLYAGVCWLIFEVLKKISSEKMAFWGTIIFAVLPIHTEVINNVVGRAEMLSLGFVLIAILLLFKKRWEGSAGVYLLALLSKETAIVGLPIFIYLLVIGKEKKDAKIGVSSLYVLVTICFLVLRMVVLGGENMGNNATMVENPLKFLSTSQRVMNAFSLVPFGVGKILFPLNLSYDYSFNQLKLIANWFDWRVILGILLMISSLIIVCRRLLRRNTPRNDGLILGQAFFWGPILITGNFLFPVGTIFGERLWFWSSLGLIMMLSTLFNPAVLTNLKNQTLFRPARKPSIFCSRKFLDLPRNQAFRLCAIFFKSAKYFGFVLIIILSGRTLVRNIDWLSQERLFIHDAIYAKDSVMAQSNAAAMYLLKKDFVKGKEYLEKADRIYPNYPELMNNWGMYYLWKGDPKMAKERFEFCLKEKPEYFLCKENIKLIK